jgi:hypothetical protein
MKKFGITLMAAALSLPVMFAASQTTPAPAGQAQTSTAKTSRKSHKVAKKHHTKKQKGVKGSAAMSRSTPAPVSK